MQFSLFFSPKYYYGIKWIKLWSRVNAFSHKDYQTLLVRRNLSCPSTYFHNKMQHYFLRRIGIVWSDAPLIYLDSSYLSKSYLGRNDIFILIFSNFKNSLSYKITYIFCILFRTIFTCVSKGNASNRIGQINVICVACE